MTSLPRRLGVRRRRVARARGAMAALAGAVAADDLGQVAHPRPCPDLVEHLVRPRRLLQLRHRAAVVLEAAERDRARRACLLACGDDGAVAHWALLVTVGVVLSHHDALDAHRALSHDAELP